MGPATRIPPGAVYSLLEHRAELMRPIDVPCVVIHDAEAQIRGPVQHVDVMYVRYLG